MTSVTWSRLDTEELLSQARNHPTRMLRRLAALPKDNQPSLGVTLRGFMDRNDTTPRELMFLAGLSKQYMYQILNNQRLPGRSMLIVFAIVLKLDLDETQRLLRVARKPELYVKITRDAALICAIERRMTIETVNDTLVRLGETPLTALDSL